MSDILEALLSEPKIVISLAVSIPLGICVGSYLGLLAGLIGFGASFLSLLTALLVRSWAKKR